VRTCWILTEGIAGTENQCIGLAEALGLSPEIIRAKAAAPWVYLPPGLIPISSRWTASDPLTPPWPGILIASGRKCVDLALAVKRASRKACFTIFVQNPRVSPARFDVVVVPRHDGVEGANVIQTMGALNRITPERLLEHGARFENRIAELPHPRVGVLVGGASRRHHFAPEDARKLGQQLSAMAVEAGGSIMLTASRRTPGASLEALKQSLGSVPAFIWDGSGENPYFGILAAAEVLVVTDDSISMTSEACTTGKPVLVAAMPGRGSQRFRTFFRELEAAGHVRPFTARIERWDVTPLADTAQAASAISERLEAHTP